MEYKYKARFTCLGSVVKPDSEEGQKIAKASIKELESLRSLAPADEVIASNPDLLYVNFNGAVTSLVNLNHDCIDNETAVQISKSFINRYINIEHDRNQCIGVILNSGFSTFKDNQMVDSAEVAANNKPYNMSFSGVIWKTVDPSFASVVEESNQEGSWAYRKVSASWEIGFNEWSIIRGSRTLENAEVISDPVEVEALSKYLVDEGGSGFDDQNREVYRLIKGGYVLGLGMGLVRHPAASVNGVQVIQPMDNEMEKDCYSSNESLSSFVDLLQSEETRDALKKLVDERFLAAYTKAEGKNIENNDKNEKIISQYQKNIVKARKNMKKFKTTDELLSSLEVSEASTVSPQMVREFIEEAAYEAGKALKVAKDEAEAKVKETETKLASQESVATDLSEKVKTLESQVADLKTQLEVQAKQSLFQERMASLAESYNLDEKVQKKIAKDIRDLDEKEYQEWLKEDAEVILASRKKDAGESKEDEALKLMKQAEAKQKLVPNAGETEDLKRKVAKRGEDFEISFTNK